MPTHVGGCLCVVGTYGCLLICLAPSLASRSLIPFQLNARKLCRSVGWFLLAPVYFRVGETVAQAALLARIGHGCPMVDSVLEDQCRGALCSSRKLMTRLRRQN